MPPLPKYSAQQKRAIVEAQLDHGLTAKATHTAARNGQLPGDTGANLEPFQPSLPYIRELAWRERRYRRSLEIAQTDPDALLTTPAQRLLLAYENAVEDATRGTRKPTPTQLAQYAKAGREIHAFLKALQQKPRKTQDPRRPHAPADDNQPDFLDTLANHTEGNGRSAPNTHPHPSPSVD